MERAETDHVDERDITDKGREVLGCMREGSIMMGMGGGGGYVPGSVLVITSVSTVLVRSTTPSKLMGSARSAIAVPDRLVTAGGLAGDVVEERSEELGKTE